MSKSEEKLANVLANEINLNGFKIKRYNSSVHITKKGADLKDKLVKKIVYDDDLSLHENKINSLDRALGFIYENTK